MTKRSRFIQIISVLSLVLSATPALPQGTILVGPSTRNGSFEDGVASPWREVLVSQDPSFASEGSWYAVLQDTARGTTARAGASLRGLPATPDHGLTFILTFDARSGLQAFDTVYGAVNVWNGDGTPVFVSATPIASPPLSSLTWMRYETVFQVPETWDGGGNVMVVIQFTKHGAVIGTTYTGYLDNIVLQQIPEPSVFALCGVGVILWAAGLMRRRNAFRT